MEKLSLYEQIDAVREAVDPEDHAIAGLGVSKRRESAMERMLLRQMDMHPSASGSKFVSPETLEESENRSDAETVFFFRNRGDALSVYAEGINMGLASGEITFDPTVDEKFGVGRFAVRFAPHVRTAKREILYSLYTRVQEASGAATDLPRMFDEWLDESGVLVVEMRGEPHALPQGISAKVPSGRMHLDYQGGRGNGHRRSTLSKGARARDRFDRAARSDASKVVDTSAAQVPVEGGRHGNKYSNPAPDPYATDSTRRGAYEASPDIFAGLEIDNPEKPRTLASMIDGKLDEAGWGTKMPDMSDEDWIVLDAANELKLVASTLSGTGGRVEVTPRTGKAALNHLDSIEKKLKGVSRQRKKDLMARIKSYREKAKKIMNEETLTERYTGHHAKIGGKWYVDTSFMNAIGNNLPGFSLRHLGFGEFELVGPDGGEIQFDRMRGKDFPGKEGRSHQLYDNKGGKLVQKLIKAMEKAKASTMVESDEEQLDERMTVSGTVERQALRSKLAKAIEDEKKRKKKKGKMMAKKDEDTEEDGDPIDERRGMPVSGSVERAAMLSKLKKKASAKKKRKKDDDDDQYEDEDPLAAELNALLGEDYTSEQLPFLLG